MSGNLHLWGDPKIVAKAKGLHDAECMSDCPYGVTTGWLEYAEVKLRLEARSG